MFKFLLVMSCIFLITVQAKENKAKENKIKIGISILNGQSNEFVYRTNGKTLSELNWRLNNVKLLNIAYTKSLGKIDFEIDIFKNIAREKNIMDDHDWLSTQSHPDDWTHWSQHENTTVENILKVDLGLRYNLIKLKKTNIYLKVGYKHDTFKWIARNNGTYIYTREDTEGSNTYENNFRDNISKHTNTDPGITYQQYFNSLYYSIGIDDFKPVSSIPLTIQAYIQYSNLVTSTDEDTHHNFNTKYIEIMEHNGDMLNVLLGITYNINKRLDIQLNYERDEYKLSRGYSEITNLKTGFFETSSDNTAGVSHKSSIMSIKIVSKF